MIARFIGPDEVCEAYRKSCFDDCAYFSMWCKSQVVCQYNGDSFDEGEEMIREELERNKKRKFNMECVLKLHPKFEKSYTLKSDTHYNIVFKSYQDNGENGGKPGDMYLYDKLGQILENQNALMSRMNALEEEDDTEEPEGEMSGINDTMIDKIDKLLDKPIISKLIGRIFFDDEPVEERTHSLAGPGPVSVEDQQKILAAAIQTLINKGVKVEHFVKLSKMSAVKIKSLLAML